MEREDRRQVGRAKRIVSHHDRREHNLRPGISKDRYAKIEVPVVRAGDELIPLLGSRSVLDSPPGQFSYSLLSSQNVTSTGLNRGNRVALFGPILPLLQVWPSRSVNIGADHGKPIV
jgi:hypothetical protein